MSALAKAMQATYFVGGFVVVLSVAVTLITIFEQNNMARSGDPYRNFNIFINDLFFQYSGTGFLRDTFYQNLGEEYGYYLSSYCRDLVMGIIVYWLTAGLWHVFIYRINGEELFVRKKRPFPSNETIIDQMLLAQSSLFMYAGLPVFSEFLIEKKFTKVYFYLDEIGGWKFYVFYLILYLLLVEFGVYWVHRTLHENKFLYKYVHGLHHKYNKSSTLTPWASIAFNPIDGLLQVRVRILPSS